jgi:tetratricopeptide (TPR) repeat protein
MRNGAWDVTQTVKTVILLSGLLAALSTGACQRSAQTYLKSGDAHFKAQKYSDASLDYQNAIRIDAKLGEAYYGLGLSELKQNRLDTAWPALRAALDLLPDRADVKVQVADLALAAYQMAPRERTLYDLLHKLSDQLLAKDPNSFDGLKLKGDLALLDQKPDQAVDYFRRANDVKPFDEHLIVGYTRALLDSGNAESAEQLARQLIAQKKDFGPIYDFLYRLYTSTGRQGAAVEILQEEIRNNPKDANAIIQLASHYEHANNPAAMASALQEILDNRTAFADGHLLVGNFYARRQRWDEAVTVFQEGLKVDPDRAGDYRKRIAVAYLNQHRTDDALELLDQLLRTTPGDQEAAVLKANLLLDRGKPDDLPQVIATYESAVKSHPEDAAVREHLGRAYLAKNDPTNARQALLAALKIEPVAEQPRVLLAGIAIHEGKSADALEFLDNHGGTVPVTPRMRYLRVVAFMILNRYEDARGELDTLLRDNPKSSDLLLLKGILAVATKRYKEAESTFASVPLSPSDPRAVAGLADAYVSEQRSDKALKLLEAALRRTPGSVAIRRAYAKTALIAGRYDNAIAQFERLVAAQPKSASLLSDLGEAYRAKGEFQKAVDEFEQASRISPKDPAIRLLLSFALYQSGRIPEAMAKYREVLTLDPQNATAMNNLAYALAEKGGRENLAEAVQLAQKAVKIRPATDFRDTLGWIYFKQGVPDSAMQIFESVAREQPKNPSYQHHLALALLAKHNQAGARQALENALADNPTEAEAREVRDELTKIR